VTSNHHYEKIRVFIGRFLHIPGERGDRSQTAAAFPLIVFDSATSNSLLMRLKHSVALQKQKELIITGVLSSLLAG
jgi:hypothetical protein